MPRRYREDQMQGSTRPVACERASSLSRGTAGFVGGIVLTSVTRRRWSRAQGTAQNEARSGIAENRGGLCLCCHRPVSVRTRLRVHAYKRACTQVPFYVPAYCGQVFAGMMRCSWMWLLWRKRGRVFGTSKVLATRPCVCSEARVRTCVAYMASTAHAQSRQRAMKPC